MYGVVITEATNGGNPIHVGLWCKEFDFTSKRSSIKTFDTYEQALPYKDLCKSNNYIYTIKVISRKNCKLLQKNINAKYTE